MPTIKLSNGLVILKMGRASCSCCGPKLPVDVYRAGGYSFGPGISCAAGCTPVLIGTIFDEDGSVDVSYGCGSTYSSVEALAIDADGDCVYYNNETSPSNEALITVRYSDMPYYKPVFPGEGWCDGCTPPE